MNEETIETTEDEQFYIGDFPVDPETIVASGLPTRTEIVFEVAQSERRSYEGKEGKPGGNYNSLTLKAPDFPGQTLFHTFFLNADALGHFSTARSWSKFLAKMGLPYTTTAKDNGLVGVKFRATVRTDEKREEQKIDKIVGPAE